MENHLKFLPGQQKHFLLQISQTSGLSTNRLAKLVNISPRNYRDWKREKINISMRAAKILSRNFNITLPEKEKILVSRWKKAKSEAGRIGGFACQKKYGCLIPLEARKKEEEGPCFFYDKKGLFLGLNNLIYQLDITINWQNLWEFY